MSAPSLSVPKTWDDITPEWMSAALAADFPGARVDTVTVELRDDGTNRRARLGLTYQAGNGPGHRLRQGRRPRAQSDDPPDQRHVP